MALIFVAFIIPLACYCLFLSHLNRGRHPVVVPGPWDFAAVLLGLSGFLVLGGPATLTGLYERWRLSWLLGQERFLPDWTEPWHFWVTGWFAYLSLVLFFAGGMLWTRRRQTSVYNVAPGVMEHLLGERFARLGFRATSNGPSGLLGVADRRSRTSAETDFATQRAFSVSVATF